MTTMMGTLLMRLISKLKSSTMFKVCLTGLPTMLTSTSIMRQKSMSRTFMEDMPPMVTENMIHMVAKIPMETILMEEMSMVMTSTAKISTVVTPTVKISMVKTSMEILTVMGHTETRDSLDF